MLVLRRARSMAAYAAGAGGAGILALSTYSRTDAETRFKMPGHDQVFRVVLTGGPCAGKSTAGAEIRERCEELGLQLIAVPELATMFNRIGPFARCESPGIRCMRSRPFSHLVTVPPLVH